MDIFLPTSLEEGKRYYKDFSGFDVIFISGDPYFDHPLSGTALLARLLDQKGYKVGIVSEPETDHEFLSCGAPKFFFCITSGLLDSMLANYTPILKKRENILVPERALIAYTQKIKQLFKGKMTVIGGVEATIRRFTHFDYKENKLRRGILNDTKADLLVFGNADRTLLTLLSRLKKLDSAEFDRIKERLELSTIDGLAYRIRENEMQNIRELPSYESCVEDKNKFNLLTLTHYLLPDDAFIERCGVGIIRHNRMSHPLAEEEMDYVYSVPFTRRLHPKGKQYSLNQGMLDGFENSVVIGRGCWGSCNFCIIPLVQGKNIAKRSINSITKEIELLYRKGTKKINDLTLPTINMYGSYCNLYDQEETIFSPIIGKDVKVYNKTEYCDQNCVGCKHRVLRDDLYELLVEVEKLNKQYNSELEVRSAIRHDVILSQKKLFE
ncbi:MAG: hypothetical protein HGA85_06970, partial [Nanoarchaeota archaeon]|nr:hypothetical protein [Nanoarchaeota archaeon]